MNEVYIIIEDNGDCYEDYSEWIDKIFLDEELAKKYIKIKKAKWKRIEKKDDMADIHGFRLEKHKLVGDVNEHLQNNWNELKKWVEEQKEYLTKIDGQNIPLKDSFEFCSMNELYQTGKYSGFKESLDKMQELEQGKDE